MLSLLTIFLYFVYLLHLWYTFAWQYILSVKFTSPWHNLDPKWWPWTIVNVLNMTTLTTYLVNLVCLLYSYFTGFSLFLLFIFLALSICFNPWTRDWLHFFNNVAYSSICPLSAWTVGTVPALLLFLSIFYFRVIFPTVLAEREQMEEYAKIWIRK